MRERNAPFQLGLCRTVKYNARILEEEMAPGGPRSANTFSRQE